MGTSVSAAIVSTTECECVSERVCELSTAACVHVGVEVTVCLCLSGLGFECVCISLYMSECVCLVGFMSISQAIFAISTCL